jgi:hypothetical protein
VSSSSSSSSSSSPSTASAAATETFISPSLPSLPPLLLPARTALSRLTVSASLVLLGAGRESTEAAEVESTTRRGEGTASWPAAGTVRGDGGLEPEPARRLETCTIVWQR